jgi:hypothetical protein
MKSTDIQTLITYRMERSKEAVKAAEIMLENSMLTYDFPRPLSFKHSCLPASRFHTLPRWAVNYEL